MTKESTALAIQADNSMDFYFDVQKFEQLQRAGRMFAESGLVPKHYDGNVAACSLAIVTAVGLGMNPLNFMQRSYVVNGKQGIEASLMVAIVNKSGVFSDRISYEIEHDKEGRPVACTASATIAKTGQKVSERITWDTVQKEWLSKDGSKWKTMPEHMFKYRTAAWLIRHHCPEVVFGLSTIDELMDNDPIDVTPKRGAIEDKTADNVVNLKDKIAAAKEKSNETKEAETPQSGAAERETDDAPSQSQESTDKVAPDQNGGDTGMAQVVDANPPTINEIYDTKIWPIKRVENYLGKYHPNVKIPPNGGANAKRKALRDALEAEEFAKKKQQKTPPPQPSNEGPGGLFEDEEPLPWAMSQALAKDLDRMGLDVTEAEKTIRAHFAAQGLESQLEVENRIVPIMKNWNQFQDFLTEIGLLM